MSDDLTASRNAAWRAMRAAEALEQSIKHKSEVPDAELAREMRDAEAELSGVKQADPLLQVKMRVLSFMVNVLRAEPCTCDKIFHFKSGTTQRIMTEHPQEFQFALRESVDRVLDEFYRNKISVLEELSTSAPAAVKFLGELLDHGTKSDKIEATRQLQRWTEMLLRNKQSKAVKELFSEDLKSADEEADNWSQQLESILEKELIDGGDGPN